MSLYEALALFTLAAAGAFACYLYRKDTRPKSPGEEVPERVNRPLFARTPQKRGDDG